MIPSSPFKPEENLHYFESSNIETIKPKPEEFVKKAITPRSQSSSIIDEMNSFNESKFFFRCVSHKFIQLQQRFKFCHSQKLTG